MTSDNNRAVFLLDSAMPKLIGGTGYVIPELVFGLMKSFNRFRRSCSRSVGLSASGPPFQATNGCDRTANSEPTYGHRSLSMSVPAKGRRHAR
jgi:hypothetical protein